MGNTVAVHENNVRLLPELVQGGLQDGGFPEAEEAGHVGESHRPASGGRFDNDKLRQGHDHGGAIDLPVGCAVGGIDPGDEAGRGREGLEAHLGPQALLAGQGFGRSLGQSRAKSDMSRLSKNE